MRGKLGLTATVLCWALLPLAVLGHAALAVLAVAEFATMGWPPARSWRCGRRQVRGRCGH